MWLGHRNTSRLTAKLVISETFPLIISLSLHLLLFLFLPLYHTNLFYTVFLLSFKSHRYPYLCFGYKLPTGHTFAIEVNITDYGWRTIAGSSSAPDNYRSQVIAYIENDPNFHSGIVDDNKWVWIICANMIYVTAPKLLYIDIQKVIAYEQILVPVYFFL